MLSKKLLSTLVVLGAAIHAAPAQATTFDVENKNDAGPYSLRQAILDANATPNVNGPDEIRFDIPGAGSALHKIVLATDLPVVTHPLNVWGYTQPGAVRATANTPATIKIGIDASQVADGLVVRTQNSVIRGLVVINAGSVAGGGVGVRLWGDGNQLAGSWIGVEGSVDPKGHPFFVFGNAGDGVEVVGDDNIIGGAAPEDGNVISANGKLAGTDADGVSIVGDDNKVRGNAIGTDPAITSGQIGNDGAGVRIDGARNSVGGSFTGNVISGNGKAVVVASGAGNEIMGNMIGTDRGGELALGNSYGVVLEATGNTVGGDALLKGNVISGTQAGPGVEVIANGNTVQGNLIGTDVWGENALPNLTGIRVTGDENLIGGGSSGYGGNVVSGNLFSGISVDQGNDGIVLYPLQGNHFVGNLIGTAANATDPVPNGHDGISILDGTNNTIGSNVIAFNGDSGDGNGVAVSAGFGNSILGNSIFENAELGIDLGRDGVTLNDPDDADAGANMLQNHPEIAPATATMIDWTLDSAPLTRYRIEFFASGPSCDGSGHGEGPTLLGSTYASTDTSGEADGSAALTTAVPAGDLVTATATVDLPFVREVEDDFPSLPDTTPAPGPAATSEFSPCVPVP